MKKSGKNARRTKMNLELMRTKMKEKEHEEIAECSQSDRDRLWATFTGARGKCSMINEKYSLWMLAMIAPYLLGFILITILCLSMVNISMDTYFTVLAENFSVFGLWTIGYFLFSIIIIFYLVTKVAIRRP